MQRALAVVLVEKAGPCGPGMQEKEVTALSTNSASGELLPNHLEVGTQGFAYVHVPAILSLLVP